VSRVLTYCGFLADENPAIPATGVNGERVNVFERERLRLLWSEIEWPLAQNGLQKSALEFHGVIQRVFQQTAVIPFRLLSIFNDIAALHEFAAEHRAGFVADLERLREYVQMESVVYVIAATTASNPSSGRAYLEQKAEVVRLSSQHAERVQETIKGVSREVQAREVKSGTRIFALVQRGDEGRFRNAVETVPLPPPVSRRVSGPWPVSEFLSEAVKTPQIAGQR
jgi:Gas vesicle synthesis protein GvpL/GvpF